MDKILCIYMPKKKAKKVTKPNYNKLKESPLYKSPPKPKSFKKKKKFSSIVNNQIELEDYSLLNKYFNIKNEYLTLWVFLVHMPPYKI